MLDVCFDTTRTAFSLVVHGVTKRYPEMRFILAHAGGAVSSMAARVGITFSLFDTASGMAAHPVSPRAFSSLRTLVDSSKIVFGTDYVFATEAIVAPTDQGVDRYPEFSDRDVSKVARQNAVGLFPKRLSA